MSIPKIEHILEQADRLIATSAGPTRQADFRRALSSTYYAVFHFTMTRIADQFVGSTQRASAVYALFYRSVDHRQLRSICSEVLRRQPSQKYLSYVPQAGWTAELRDFSAVLIDLQEKRSAADYDPRASFHMSDVKLAIQAARSALTRFQATSVDERKAFLALLVCPPR